MKCGHFLRRHMIRSWRDQKRKSDIFSFGAMLAGVGGAGAGVYLGDYVQLAQLGTLMSLFKYSREMEAEADAMGARLIAEAGYQPMEIARVWYQLIGEEAASARYRRKRRDRGYDAFATHPASETRMADLKAERRRNDRPRQGLHHRPRPLSCRRSAASARPCSTTR